MWVFLSDAYVSVVADRRRPSRLLVRARVEGDLERVLPGCSVEVTPRADYRFRTSVKRVTLIRALERSVRTIDYDNFKNSVDDTDRHNVYLRCWAALSAWQRGGYAPAKPGIAQLEAGYVEEPDMWNEPEGDYQTHDPDALDDHCDVCGEYEAECECRPVPDSGLRTRTQTDLFTQAADPRAAYSGFTFNAELDRRRLDSAMSKVLGALLTERWHTLPELRELGGSAADSRARDLRKPEWGAFAVETRRAVDFPAAADLQDFTVAARRAVAVASEGVWLYRIRPYSVTPASVEQARKKLRLDKPIHPRRVAK